MSLTTNVEAMGPGDTLVISAVVTDPDGVDDLLGGLLFGADGQTAYGAFESNAPGSYELSLTWAQLHTFEPIEAPAGGGSRTFRATFFDQSGSSVSRDLSVEFRCDTPSDAICSGECADLQSDPDHCGACGNSDPDGILPCVGGRLECGAEALLCEGVCEPAERFEDDLENCGVCGNDCSVTAEDTRDVDYAECRASTCHFEVYTNDDDDCATICRRRGLRCDDSVSGTQCSPDDPTLYAGCSGAHDDVKNCTVYLPRSTCSDAAYWPTDAQTHAECGSPSSDFWPLGAYCDCVL